MMSFSLTTPRYRQDVWSLARPVLRRS